MNKSLEDTLADLRDLSREEERYRQMLDLDPNQLGPLRMLGLLLLRRDADAEGELLLARAAALMPQDAEILQNHAVALLKLMRFDEAERVLKIAVALKPDYARGHFNLADALHFQSKHESAIIEYQRAIELGWQDPALFYRLAKSHKILGQKTQAVHYYSRALAVSPDSVEALVNRAVLLMDMHRAEEALADYDRAYFLAPNFPLLEGARLVASLAIANWREFDSRCRQLVQHLEARMDVVWPMQLYTLPSTASQHRLCAELYSNIVCPPQPSIRTLSGRAPRRLRIAYLSKDIRQHATAILLADVLAAHDRDAVEIFVFALSSADDSEIRSRISASVEHFVACDGMDDVAVASAIAENGIDIAVDLDGHTLNSRQGILARRPATLQVNYLGLPGTMGASHIDYILADRIVIPQEHLDYYSEKVVWMPGTYQPNSLRIEIVKFSRDDACLPPEKLVFGCFNSDGKVSPDVFALWMNILKRVPNSILWLFGERPAFRENAKQEATAQGVDPSRLLFLGRRPLNDYFSCFALMDIFLDTFYYGAHTTASDALWSGVPVISKLGETFPGRVAASVLTAIGLPELITHSDQAYEDLAVALAEDPARLAEVRAKIQAQRGRLFNPAQYARNLEAAFRQMWARHEAGQKPESFAVSPTP